MQSWTSKTLSTFLAVSVLAGSVLPPAYAHSHSGGNGSENQSKDKEQADHSRRHPRAHHHHGEGHHHHPPATSTESSRGVPSDSGLHWHVTFFFFDFTLPSLPIPGGGSQNDGNFPLTVARLVDLSRLTPTESSLFGMSWQQPTDLNPIDSFVAEFESPTQQHPPSSRFLLCDTARRERSGVLLT